MFVSASSLYSATPGSVIDKILTHSSFSGFDYISLFPLKSKRKPGIFPYTSARHIGDCNASPSPPAFVTALLLLPQLLLLLLQTSHSMSRRLSAAVTSIQVSCTHMQKHHFFWGKIRVITHHTIVELAMYYQAP